MKGTQILSYEKFHCKTMQISEENELYLENENNPRSLASNFHVTVIYHYVYYMFIHF